MAESTQTVQISSSKTEQVLPAGWQAYWGWENYINYNLDAESGDTTKLVEQPIPGNAKVRSVSGSLTGSPHDGSLRHFSGTSVSAGTIEYSTSGYSGDAVVTQAGESSKAFIIDFGGIRKIKALAVADVDEKLPNIVLVLPWMGIEFGSKPLFPYGENLKLATDSKANVSFPEVETAKLFVQFESPVADPPGKDTHRSDAILDKLFIISSTMPLNTKVAVGNRPPFHTFAGELKEETPLPEFSEELNAYLDDIRAAGAEDVENFPLMITMDAPGKISLGDFQLIYDREAKAQWGDAGRHSLNFDRQETRHLKLEFPAGKSTAWKIQSISFDVTHDFPQWRSFPRDTSTVSDRISATVRSDLNIAQCLTMDETTEIYGIGIFMSANGENSEILIEIQKDLDGEPDDTPVFGESVAITAGDEAGWLDLMFSKPLEVRAGRDLWFVIKSKVGQLSVVLDKDSGEKAAMFNRNSAGYKPFPFNGGNMAVCFRQYRKPAMGETARAVSLEIAGKTLESDLPEETNTLIFSYLDPESGTSDGPSVSPLNNRVELDLKITAHTSGSITFQNVIARYQHEPA